MKGSSDFMKVSRRGRLQQETRGSVVFQEGADRDCGDEKKVSVVL